MQSEHHTRREEEKEYLDLIEVCILSMHGEHHKKMMGNWNILTPTIDAYKVCTVSTPEKEKNNNILIKTMHVYLVCTVNTTGK